MKKLILCGLLILSFCFATGCNKNEGSETVDLKTKLTDGIYKTLSGASEEGEDVPDFILY